MARLTIAILPFLLLSPALQASDHFEVRLWPDGAPGAVGKESQDQPALSVYLSRNAGCGPVSRPGHKNAGVVVCPGGGYGFLAVDHEGRQIAEWLNARGISAFVLKYRIAPRYHHPAPLQDAQRAIRAVRARAQEWNVDPHKIGIWGFSAGGHLASTAATHFDGGNAKAADFIERASCRPDFLILCYPVITFLSPATHVGSRENLIGKHPDPELAKNLSNETQVTARTPPTFLFHTDEDSAVPPENSVLFYQALKKAGVKAELHIYERGPHGVGLAQKDPILSTWSDRLADWLKGNNWVK